MTNQTNKWLNPCQRTRERKQPSVCRGRWKRAGEGQRDPDRWKVCCCIVDISSTTTETTTLATNTSKTHPRCLGMTRQSTLSSGDGLGGVCNAWTTVGLLLHPWANPMIALASRCVNRAAHMLISWPMHLSLCNTIHIIKKRQVCVCLGMCVCVFWHTLSWGRMWARRLLPHPYALFSVR